MTAIYLMVRQTELIPEDKGLWRTKKEEIEAMLFELQAAAILLMLLDE